MPRENSRSLRCAFLFLRKTKAPLGMTDQWFQQPRSVNQDFELPGSCKILHIASVLICCYSTSILRVSFLSPNKDDWRIESLNYTGYFAIPQ